MRDPGLATRADSASATIPCMIWVVVVLALASIGLGIRVPRSWGSLIAPTTILSRVAGDKRSDDSAQLF